MRYAAYGSNLHPLRLCARTPSAALQGTDVIAGYTLAFLKRARDGSAKCTIAPAAGSFVHVAVYEIDDAEKGKLDEAEGLGFGYEIQRFELARFAACLAYVAQPGHLDATLKPYTWYKELVLAGCEAHGFPDDYVQRIRAVEAVVDPQAARHAQHMAIVTRARATLARWCSKSRS